MMKTKALVQLSRGKAFDIRRVLRAIFHQSYSYSFQNHKIKHLKSETVTVSCEDRAVKAEAFLNYVLSRQKRDNHYRVSDWKDCEEE